MKKLIILCALCTMLFSCNSKSEPESFTQVSFNVNTELSVEVEGPNKSPQATSSVPTKMYVLDSGKQIYYGTFKDVTLTLSAGVHDLTFIATPRETSTYVDGVFKPDKIADSYGCKYTCRVFDGMDIQRVILSRINCDLVWESTDVFPADGYTCDIQVLSCYVSVDYELNGVEVSYKDDKNLPITNGKVLRYKYSLYTKELNKVDSVTTILTLYKPDKTVFAVYNKTVPVVSNKKTIITGHFLGEKSNNAIMYDDQWKQETIIKL